MDRFHAEVDPSWPRWYHEHLAALHTDLEARHGDIQRVSDCMLSAQTWRFPQTVRDALMPCAATAVMYPTLKSNQYNSFEDQVCWLIWYAQTQYTDVIVSAMASQITSFPIVYSTVYSDADQRKHQSSASLAFVRGIHRWPLNSAHKGPVTRKMFSFDDVIMVPSHASVPHAFSGMKTCECQTKFY